MKRYFFLILGFFAVALAFAGVFLPGIPTTPFLIIALWAFAKSSKKFHSWLLNHKKFGPLLQNWESHRVVPKKGKILMVVFQFLAILFFYYSTGNIYLTALLAIVLIIIARWVISFPSELPKE